MKLRTVIADDEPLARNRLRRLLAGESDIEIVAECADGPATIEAVRASRPDLLLLDVQMPGMDGFEVLRTLGNEHLPAVVFVTGFDRHAVRAFENRAVDYLLKPTTAERLAEALRRVRERLGADPAAAIPQALLDLLREREPRHARRFSIRTGDRVVFVDADEIDWAEAAGNYVILHAGKSAHMLRETMTGLEEQLPAKAFLRVSRSAILNLRRVRELRSATSGENVAILADGQRIPITRSLREIEEKLRLS